MRIRTISLVFAAAAAMILGLTGTSLAMHSGGVAHCDACHTMHNSLDDVAATAGYAKVTLTKGTAGAYLLKGSSQSAACLNCHEAATGGSKAVSTSGLDALYTTIPLQRNPAGDFAWVKKNSFHGHNINSTEYGYSEDSRLTTAPGGTYPADQLHCSSCHDPHGKYRVIDSGAVVKGGDTGAVAIVGGGSTKTTAVAAGQANGVYRLLGGKGYFPKSVGETFAFGASTDPPAVIAPSQYNKSEDSSQVRVMYGKGMSEWCANCHAGMHDAAVSAGQSGSLFKHPAGAGDTLGTLAANYNAYVKTGNMTNTDPTKGYLSLVPFELGTDLYVERQAGLAADHIPPTTNVADYAGPTASSNVMCLSCHRAHASGFGSMLRWEGGEEFITDATGAYVNDYRTPGATLAAYYDRPATQFGTNQRQLCNKCHAKD